MSAGGHELDGSLNGNARRKRRRESFQQPLYETTTDDVRQLLLQPPGTRRGEFSLRDPRLVETNRIDNVLPFARDVPRLRWLTLGRRLAERLEQASLRIDLATRLCLDGLRILSDAGEHCVVTPALLGVRPRSVKEFLDGIQRPLPFRADERKRTAGDRLTVAGAGEDSQRQKREQHGEDQTTADGQNAGAGIPNTRNQERY